MPVGTEEITGLLDKIIARYKPGGEFGKAELALLERAKTKSLASTAQGMVSAGLAGTTAGVGAGRKWEEETGMPSRLRLEDIRTERLTQAMGAKAGYIERAATREEQAALVREQMELEEKFRNRQISLQEYLAEAEMLRVKLGARGTTAGGGGGRLTTAGGGGAGGGAGGAVYPSIGGGYSGGEGFAPGPMMFREGGKERPAGGEFPSPMQPIPPKFGDVPEREIQYTNVGTTANPQMVQAGMMQSLAGLAQKWLAE